MMAWGEDIGCMNGALPIPEDTRVHQHENIKACRANLTGRFYCGLICAAPESFILPLRLLFAAVGAGAIVTYGLKGSKDANLPIIKGPQTAGENGKGGTARSRL
jgi:CBS-domain-containing membrane protein